MNRRSLLPNPAEFNATAAAAASSAPPPAKGSERPAPVVRELFAVDLTPAEAPPMHHSAAAWDSGSGMHHKSPRKAVHFEPQALEAPVVCGGDRTAANSSAVHASQELRLGNSLSWLIEREWQQYRAVVVCFYCGTLEPNLTRMKPVRNDEFAAAIMRTAVQSHSHAKVMATLDQKSFAAAERFGAGLGDLLLAAKRSDDDASTPVVIIPCLLDSAALDEGLKQVANVMTRTKRNLLGDRLGNGATPWAVADVACALVQFRQQGAALAADRVETQPLKTRRIEKSQERPPLLEKSLMSLEVFDAILAYLPL